LYEILGGIDYYYYTDLGMLRNGTIKIIRNRSWRSEALLNFLRYDAVLVSCKYNNEHWTSLKAGNSLRPKHL
jgi:hypothetical protein